MEPYLQNCVHKRYNVIFGYLHSLIFDDHTPRRYKKNRLFLFAALIFFSQIHLYNSYKNSSCAILVAIDNEGAQTKLNLNRIFYWSQSKTNMSENDTTMRRELKRILKTSFICFDSPQTCCIFFSLVGNFLPPPPIQKNDEIFLFSIDAAGKVLLIGRASYLSTGPWSHTLKLGSH